MNTMQDNYKGSLTLKERTNIDTFVHSGESVRQAAKSADVPYGKARGYVEWSEKALPDLLPPPPADQPAILIFDIETTPSQGWFWGHSIYKVNVIDIIEHWFMLSVAYKWLGQDEVGYFGLSDDPHWTGGSTNDSYVVKRLHRLLDQADIIITQNGDKFDVKSANTRFLKHGLGPTSPFQSIDTLTESRRYFKRESHSLKYQARFSGIEEKRSNSGLQLWFDCMDGVPEAWEEIKGYNVQDVVVTEELYLELRPWMGTPGKKGHPNLGHWVYSDEVTCPNCASDRLAKRGRHRTKVSVFQTYQCKECGAYSRSRLRDPQRTQADNVHLV